MSETEKSWRTKHKAAALCALLLPLCLWTASCSGISLGRGGRAIVGQSSYGNRKHPLNMPDEYILDGETLSRNGMGFDETGKPKTYHCAFYSLNPPERKEDILARSQPMVLRIVFGRNTYRDDLFAVWRTVFDRNVDPENEDAWLLFERFENAFPREMERGDRLDLIYRPERGLEIKMFTESRARLNEPPDPRIMFRIWLGEQPVDPYLKRKLLWRVQEPGVRR